MMAVAVLFVMMQMLSITFIVLGFLTVVGV